MNDKLRIRTNEELDNHLMELSTLRNILNELNIQWFLVDGTLLGAVRSNDFIPWDWDIGISVFADDLRSQLNHLSDVLKKHGYQILKVDNTKKNIKIIFSKSAATFEVRGWYLRGKYLLRKQFKIPAHFFSNTEDVVLRGEVFPAPSPVRSFLTWNYGDWEIPLRSDKKQKYLSSKYWRKSYLLNLQMKKISIRLKKLITGSK